MQRLNEIFERFDVPEQMVRVEVCDKGHINDTYIVYTNTPTRYILQKINGTVFKNIDRLMDNIVHVTDFLREKVKRRGGDTARECMTLIKTKDGNSFCWYCDDNAFWRMYLYIDGASTYQKVIQPKQFFGAGKAYGRFQSNLSDFEVSSLYEVIPDFHNTVKRIEALNAAVKADCCGRVREVGAELDFALANTERAGVIVDMLEKGAIPFRVTHNDTKLNNVMIDDLTGDGLCVIDLDTVMGGAGVYDFGDAIRSGCNTAEEGAQDLESIGFDIGLFEQFARGFIGEVGNTYNSLERELLSISAMIITYECGIRFLTDYINGDTYFKIKYENHNLNRTRAQFKLLRKMESNHCEMENIIKAIFKGRG